MNQEFPFSRLLVLTMVVTLAVITAFLSSYGLGRQFKPAKPPLSIATIGRIEHLRMPDNARELDDVRSFIIRMDGAEDYGRVFVNNYVALDNESPSDLFGSMTGNKIARDKAISMAVNRGDYRVGVIDVRNYLQNGHNYIVMELENVARLPRCDAKIDIVVNNVELEGFPKLIPDRIYLDIETVNASIKSRLDALHIPAVNDSVCARRIWEFEL